jgi:hypothetical protein
MAFDTATIGLGDDDRSLIFEKNDTVKPIDDLNWNKIQETLDGSGYAHVPDVLSEIECKEIARYYGDEKLFRSTINMQRYRFGNGEYKYLTYPLPPLVAGLRKSFYNPLVTLANEWAKRLNIDVVYPEDHEEFISRCHAQGQKRPTPLILRYEEDGFNTLHQDLYGTVYFPFQVVFILSNSQADYTGGQLVFVEQLPRAQSKAEVVAPQRGDAIIFTTNFRPVKGARGYYRARMKHGVSRVTSGVRFALGIIFHDAA